MSSISLQKLTKHYARKQVLKPINLEIADREFLVLLGPSGCGKTTMLNIMAGLTKESGGQVLIDGQSVNHLSPAQRDIGFVFQNYALYPNKTVYQNLAFSLKFKKANAPEFETYRRQGNPLSKKALIDLRVREIGKILELEDQFEARPHQLSGGQRQRVAIGRAMVRLPKAYFFDEPLSNLDAILRASMRQEIKEIHRKLQATIVYVTHDQAEAMTLADRIVVMNQGEILQVDAPATIYNQPANTFVARFVGTPPMNLGTGTLEKSKNKLEIRFQDGRLPISSALDWTLLNPKNEIFFGIRPENVSLNQREGQTFVQEATVYQVEFLGGASFVYVSTGSHCFIASIYGKTELRPNDRVPLYVDLNEIQIFDGISSKSLKMKG